MAGSALPRDAADHPPWRYRLTTLGLLAAVASLLPQAVAQAAAHPWQVLGWTALLSASSLPHLLIFRKLQVETNLRMPVAIASVVVLAPQVALIVNLIALVSRHELSRGVSPWKILYNHLQFAVCAYLAALVVASIPIDLVVVATLVAVPVYDLTNLLAVAISQWLQGRGTLRETLRETAVPFPSFSSSYALTGLLAVLIVLLYQEVGPWSVTLLALPLYLGYAAMQSAKTASERAEELALRVRELEAMHELGTALLSARDEGEVLGLARRALREVCHDADPRDVVVPAEGLAPGRLQERVLPGTAVRVWVPAELDERRAAEIETACSTIGLALQRLRVEEELRESQRAEAALAEGILAEGTTARSRVALNVHDDVLPYLAAAQIQADNVMCAAALANTAMTTDLARRVRDGVSDGIAALRSVLDDLQRQTIVPGDLVPTISRTAKVLAVDHGVTVRVDVDGYDGGLSHAVEILLTETVTGLLTNVARHAQATFASVRLRTDGSTVMAEVNDNGVGFDPEQVGPGHHGLALMRQRAAIAHGVFRIESSQQLGTTVHLAVPRGAAAAPSLLGEPELRQAGQPDPAAVHREQPVR